MDWKSMLTHLNTGNDWAIDLSIAILYCVCVITVIAHFADQCYVNLCAAVQP